MNRFLGRLTRRSHGRSRCTRSECSSVSASTRRPRSRCSSSPAVPRAPGSRGTRSSACPILFAAGMSLLDTIDGSFMNFAYGWAFSKPVRKVFYNITITGLSVARRAGHRHGRARWADRLRAQPDRLLLELVRDHQHQRPRLRHRRSFRGDLGHRGVGVATRPDRGALDGPPARRRDALIAMAARPSPPRARATVASAPSSRQDELR